MTATNGDVERWLWAAADELRARSRLTASDYSRPAVEPIFLRFADVKNAQTEQDLTAGIIIWHLMNGTMKQMATSLQRERTAFRSEPPPCGSTGSSLAIDSPTWPLTDPFPPIH